MWNDLTYSKLIFLPWLYIHKYNVNMYSTLKNPNTIFDSTTISYHLMFSSLVIPDLNFC